MTEVDVLTGELVPSESRTLFRTDDPSQVLAAAREVAEALKGALDEGGMVQRIRDNEHVKIDGWQTLGSMLGVSAHTVWSRPIENGWEAKAEARTLDGRAVGAAEAMCTRSERTWASRDDYALRSMAQTRAMSKALRGPLGFIITLAGKSTTPAEEVDEQAYGPEASPSDRKGAERAAGILHAGETTQVATLMDRLERDAGGYLPRIVARALMLGAAHRPDAAERSTSGDAGTGMDVSDTETTPAASEPDPVPDQSQP